MSSSPPKKKFTLKKRNSLQKNNAGNGSAVPEWYRIPEIPFQKYVKCLYRLYDVLEQKHKSKTDIDVFLKETIQKFSGTSDEEWDIMEKQRLYMKSLESNMGDFHEELMGCFSEYQCMKVGNKSGCDVRKNDDSVFMEVKNRHNTMNSSAAKTVIDKLVKLADEGKMAILVEVNCPKGKVSRFGAPERVLVWNGQTAYAFLSKRETFFDDLLKTLAYTMHNFKTHDALMHLGNA